MEDTSKKNSYFELGTGHDNSNDISSLYFSEKKLYCIYVAIGQKRSTVAQLVKRLTDAGKDKLRLPFARMNDTLSSLYISTGKGTS